MPSPLFAKFNSFEKLLKAAIVLFPLSVLIFFPEGGFTSDWYNSLYLGGYVGKFFAQHFSFPTHVNAETYVGNHFPVFYGPLLYPLFGLFSSALGVHMGLRVLVLLVFSLQFYLVFKVFERLTLSLRLALVLSAIALWSMYPLTNLYNRSAIPECLATVLLHAAAAAWFLGLDSAEFSKKVFYSVLFSLCMSAMAGFHAITAYYGTSYLVVFCVVSLVIFSKRDSHFFKQHFKILVACGVFFTLVTAPWVYALVKFKSKLAIAASLTVPGYYNGIDELWIRLFPLPLDWRSVRGGVATPTSSLEAQINLPLIASLLFFLTSQRARLLSKGQKVFVYFIFALSSLNTLISAVRSIKIHFVSYINRFQVVYRMVTYSNLLILIALFFLFYFLRSKTEKTPTAFAWARPILVWSALAVLLKLTHAAAILPEGQEFAYELFLNQHDKAFLHVPTSFYSFPDYQVLSSLHHPPLSPIVSDKNISFTPAEGKNFGTVAPVRFSVKEPGWVITNVASFPWNKLELNGKEPSPSEVVDVDTSFEMGKQKLPLNTKTLAVFVATPGEHVVKFRHSPDSIYIALRTLSLVVFFTGIFYLVFFRLSLTRGFFVRVAPQH